MKNRASLETKADRVLKALMSGLSFNRFEAEILLHDHCLHSTISSLERRHNITISRHFETVEGYQGNSTRVCRYCVMPEEQLRFAHKKAKARKQKTPKTTDQDNNKGLSYVRV